MRVWVFDVCCTLDIFKTRLSCFSGGVLQRLDRMDRDQGAQTIVRTRKKLSIVQGMAIQREESQ